MKINIVNETIDNIEYKFISVENKTKMKLVLTSCGAGIRDVFIPNKNDEVNSITLSPLNLIEFKNCYHGKTIGRTSGRIENATFTINNKTAILEKNNIACDNLHGGSEGFHHRPFATSIEENDEYTNVIFSYNSPNGEGGYFGNIKLTVTYKIWEKENKFEIIYDATTDEETLLNLTNHVYWNLTGDLKDTILNHKLYLDSSKYGVLNDRFIVQKLDNVPHQFDFRDGKYVKDDVEDIIVQTYALGYDHPFSLDKTKDYDCKLVCEENGIELSVKTSYPFVVVYSDNQADPNVEVRDGLNDRKYLAICLECQYHPDGIHQMPENCGIISPQKPYHETVEYTFSKLNN